MNLIDEKRRAAVDAAELAISALAEPDARRVDDAIRWLGDAREHAYAVKAAMSAEKHASALAADDPLAGAPVTTSRLPRGARPSKNGHGGHT